MKKSWLVILMCAFAAVPAAAQNMAPPAAATAAVAAKGQMVFDVTGRRLAPVYRVTNDGAVELIIEAKMVTIPAATLSTVNGKLTTSLTKPQVVDLP
ncbi:MAG: hypothetical protein EPO08_15400 [Rhodospirillaceae bacterium]|nr:MAG: hypothetical protein EPO08_15400 [Rhodospirillaceae bacterium]